MGLIPLEPVMDALFSQSSSIPEPIYSTPELDASPSSRTRLRLVRRDHEIDLS
jgi:hypothetical protein